MDGLAKVVKSMFSNPPSGIDNNTMGGGGVILSRSGVVSMQVARMAIGIVVKILIFAF
ncbi:MAG: hypothetical protein LBS14_00340 [Holosporaceae bacterium]|jgi:hypothetical protein|nr:hypothetical protein [Holosporaceae bacterium]